MLVCAGPAVERTVELLRAFVADRHNGLVSRVNGGRIDEVFAQVGRIVEGASDQPAESKELFCRVRQRRERGEYRREINIAPILESGRRGEVPEVEV
jgi:hypothetical protein